MFKRNTLRHCFVCNASITSSMVINRRVRGCVLCKRHRLMAYNMGRRQKTAKRFFAACVACTVAQCSVYVVRVSCEKFEVVSEVACSV